MITKRKQVTALTTAALVITGLSGTTRAFRLVPIEARLPHTRLSSSVGDGSPPRRPSDDGGDDDEWPEFLDPNYQESENLERAREYISETSLPISYSEDDDPETAETNNGTAVTTAKDSSALVAPGSFMAGDLSKEALERNPYMAVVSRLSPSELIAKFTATSPPRVQNAVRSTILGLIGGLPKMAFDTTTITTGQRLASLMFQLQMTGYMFSNADYRLSLKQSLDADGSTSQYLLKGGKEQEEVDPLKGRVRGKLRIRYGGRRNNKKKENEPKVEEEETKDGGLEVEVDAAAYMSELRAEVSKLRDELTVKRKAKDDALRKDLLLYIRTLPEKELRDLTNTMSQDVLVAMKGLVNAVMAGIGEGQIGPETITEQSGEAMAQLCMWQLAIGYNLRRLEVREEMKKSLEGSMDFDLARDDDMAPGAFE